MSATITPNADPAGATPPPAVAPGALLTVPEVAAHLRLSRARVYELLSAGQLPSVRIGRSRRVRRTALAAFVDALTDGTTAGGAS